MFVKSKSFLVIKTNKWCPCNQYENKEGSVDEDTEDLSNEDSKQVCTASKIEINTSRFCIAKEVFLAYDENYNANNETIKFTKYNQEFEHFKMLLLLYVRGWTKMMMLTNMAQKGEVSINILNFLCVGELIMN